MEYVWFLIEIDKVLNSMHVARANLELLPRKNDGKSIVRLAVKKKKAGDDDNDNIDAETSIPFQRYPYIKLKVWSMILSR